jgi:hypothetical protein
MSEPAQTRPGRARSACNEVRYSLKEILAEVASERGSGAMGAEKLHRKDIRKMFRAKPRPSRAAKT